MNDQTTCVFRVRPTAPPETGTRGCGFRFPRMTQDDRDTDDAERAAALASKTDNPRLKSAWQRLAQSYQRLVKHVERVEHHAQVRREENEKLKMPD